MTNTQPLKLEKVLGLSSLSNSCFANSSSGDLFYAAGCVVVKYNPEENKQKSFYEGTKAVSSIAVSLDGKFLSVGERGNVATTSVWDIYKNEKISSFQYHKYGVGCLAFSPNGLYLVTIGFKHDRQLVLWDWRGKRKLTIQKLVHKVNSIFFHEDGEYFVTAGDRHLKWWYIIDVLDGEAVSVEGKAASILEDQRNFVFTDVICGSGSCDSLVYCTTSTGVLCLFNKSRTFEKLVQLESSTSYCMELFCTDDTPGLLVVGCANGIIRCFSPQTLEYVATLPYPAPLMGIVSNSLTTNDSKNNNNTGPTADLAYAACYALRKVIRDGNNSSSGNIGPIPKLAAVYADHSLFVWDISDIYAIAKYRSFIFHRACIWDIQFIQSTTTSSNSGVMTTSSSTVVPSGSFVTCSADNTIKIWNTDIKAQRTSSYRSIYSREMLHSIDLLDKIDDSNDDNVDSNKIQNDAQSATTSANGKNKLLELREYLCAGIPDTELPDKLLHSSTSKCCPRSLAVHPFMHELVCGDKYGRIRVFSLTSMQQQQQQQQSAVVRQKEEQFVHAAEVLSLSYSPAMATSDGGSTWYLYEEQQQQQQSQPVVLLASAGRDRLIHLFDASPSTVDYGSRCYIPIDTLDHHSASVTAVKFTADGRRFLSCGGDNKMVLHTLQGGGSTVSTTPDCCGAAFGRNRTTATTTASDGVGDNTSSSSVVLSAGLSVVRTKNIQTPPDSNINGLAVEASNKFAVTSGQDKRLNIYNLHTGKHMRAYKSESFNSELYKCDIDPSGMYIATCSFDKTISIFDFFSGELIVQVHASHSDIITGVKFSPDGRYLLSIGGDGCIMMWRVADALVKAMQDRLMELVSSAQRRSERAANTTSITDPVLHHKYPLTNHSPPPPLITSTITAAAALPPVPPTKQEENENNKNKAAAAVVKDGSSLIVSNKNSAANNKWAARVEESQGYELFGRKINPAAPPEANRNKFTIDVSSSTRPTRLVDALEAGDDVVLLSTECDAATAASEVSQDEDGDNSDEEEEDDNSHPFKPVDERNGAEKREEDQQDNYESDFEDPVTSIVINGDSDDTNSDSNDLDLDRTQSDVEGLTKTAKDLESWLEDMIRSESNLDESVNTSLQNHSQAADNKVIQTEEVTTPAAVSIVKKAPHNRKIVNRNNTSATTTTTTTTTAAMIPSSSSSSLVNNNNNDFNNDNDNDPLNKSLSSAFFKNLRLSGDAEMNERRGKKNMPVVPIAGLPTYEAAVVLDPQQIVKEKKQRDAAAEVIQMKQKLKVMEDSNTTTTTDNNTNESEQKSNSNSTNIGKNVDSYDHDEEDGYDTASTISENEITSSSSLIKNNIATSSVTSSSYLSMKTNLQHGDNIVAELTRKTVEYKNILSELERAKQKAAASFQELSQLRSSLHQSMCKETSLSWHSVTPLTAATAAAAVTTTYPEDSSSSDQLLRISIAQADELMQQFQTSFSTMTLIHQSATTTTSTNIEDMLAFSRVSEENVNNNRSSRSIKYNSSSSSSSNSGGFEDAANMSLFLEKYSDKLLDLVGEKLLNKVKDTAK